MEPSHSNAVADPKAGSAWRSPWVYGLIGLVVTVLAVNATMVYLAISTNPGLVNDDYYDRGQDYEKTLVSRLAKDPGWTMSPDFPSEITMNRPTTLRVVLVDKAGQPVTAEGVAFYAYRPADKSADFSAPMVEEGGGRYAATVSFPLLGYWDGLVAVTHEGEEYTAGGRIIVDRP